MKCPYCGERVYDHTAWGRGQSNYYVVKSLAKPSDVVTCHKCGKKFGIRLRRDYDYEATVLKRVPAKDRRKQK